MSDIKQEALKYAIQAHAGRLQDVSAKDIVSYAEAFEKYLTSKQ